MGAQWEISAKPAGALEVRLRGALDIEHTGRLWRDVQRALEKQAPKALLVDASGVTGFDGAGAGLLMHLQLWIEERGGAYSLTGLPERFQRLLELFDPHQFKEVPSREKPTRLPEDVGRASAEIWRDFVLLVAFVGELVVAMLAALRHPRKVRWPDALRAAENAGVNALPIVVLIGFLIGLIMAFQSAVPMKQFGAEIFVADLVALSMLRELGPLMTAVVLAGRSGSAFAAEIGTMKVNEEVNALVTFGLDPVRFLVVPRVIAVVAVTPLLALFSSLAGLVGGAIVLLSMGYPLVTYVNEVLRAASLDDYLGGILKSFFFGILVAAIGCLRGLQTKIGASAVGDSTTRAVVSGIVLIALADGVFSVLYYFLGI
jgi:phospholipid/cholesterol/gamma-HCH transport system permease protein